jgi:methyl-accepting chemotaxis protein
VLDNIIQGISGIADLNYQIASSTGEQSTAVGEAVENVEQINNISGENLKASELITKTNDSLDDLSHKLQDALSQFKI